jgi:gluconate 2-dehydrogenase subunit 3-like protein
MERRELFKIITVGALAGPAAAQKRPAFFTAAESAIVDRLGDIIIPTDEQSPGAHDAGVIRYVDLLAGASAPQRQEMWRRGIEAVDGAARALFSQGFAECKRTQQEEIVAAMAAHEGAPRNDLERFFELVKHAVVDGYRLSEIGVKQYMGWVGNRMDTRSWSGACTHAEHGAL